MNKISNIKIYWKSILLLIVLSSCSIAYMVTHGTWKILMPEVTGGYFINTLDNLKVGRFDLDIEKIGHFEYFLKDGKHYMYFGVFPAFLRGFIEIFFERNNGDWCRLSVILAGIITTISYTLSYYIYSLKTRSTKTQRYFYTSLFLISILFGSSLTALFSFAYIYHEAIIWGLAFSSSFTLFFIIYSRNQTNLNLLYALSISSGLALLSRVTFASTIIAFMLTIFLLLTKKNSYKKGKIRTIILSCIPLLICSLATMKINYERFGNPFTFYSVEHYVPLLNDPAKRKINMDYSAYNVRNLPYNISYYFFPSKEHFMSEFPYIKISNVISYYSFFKNSDFFSGVHFDIVEPATPITVHSFYLLIISILGIFYIKDFFKSKEWIILIAFAIQAITGLLYYALAFRFAPEFMPLIILLSLLSYKSLLKLEKKFSNRLIFRSICAFCVLLGIYGGFYSMLSYKMGLTSPDAIREIIKIFF